jgi:hypothetical protein
MLENEARARGVELSIHRVAWREEIGSAIDAANAAGAGAVNVLASPLLFSSRAFIFHRLAALRLPAVYQFPEMAEQGGLIGYGPLLVQLFRDIVSRQLAKLLRVSNGKRTSGFYALNWQAAFVPKGTPKEAVTRLNSAVMIALALYAMLAIACAR